MCEESSISTVNGEYSLTILSITSVDCWFEEISACGFNGTTVVAWCMEVPKQLNKLFGWPFEVKDGHNMNTFVSSPFVVVYRGVDSFGSMA